MFATIAGVEESSVRASSDSAIHDGRRRRGIAAVRLY
jgi:hypothetical protein